MTEALVGLQKVPLRGTKLWGSGWQGWMGVGRELHIHDEH